MTKICYLRLFIQYRYHIDRSRYLQIDTSILNLESIPVPSPGEQVEVLQHTQETRSSEQPTDCWVDCMHDVHHFYCSQFHQNFLSTYFHIYCSQFILKNVKTNLLLSQFSGTLDTVATWYPINACYLHNHIQIQFVFTVPVGCRFTDTIVLHRGGMMLSDTKLLIVRDRTIMC